MYSRGLVRSLRSYEAKRGRVDKLYTGSVESPFM